MMKISKREILDFFDGEEKVQDYPQSIRNERKRYYNSAAGRIQALLEIIDYKEGMIILEIGASPFFSSRALIKFLNLKADQFVMIDGTEPGDDTLRQEKKVFFNQEYPLYIFNAEKMRFPFEDEEFNMVICQDVIEHLLYDPLFLVNQANRVLKKDGIFILSTGPAVFSWHVSLRHLFNLNIEMGYDIKNKNPYSRHNRLFSLKEVMQMVEYNGFEILKAFNQSHWYKNDLATTLKSRISKRIIYILDRLTEKLSLLLPFLKEKAGSQIWVIARKKEYQQEISYPFTLNMHQQFDQ